MATTVPFHLPLKVELSAPLMRSPITSSAIEMIPMPPLVDDEADDVDVVVGTEPLGTLLTLSAVSLGCCRRSVACLAVGVAAAALFAALLAAAAGSGAGLPSRR